MKNRFQGRKVQRNVLTLKQEAWQWIFMSSRTILASPLKGLWQEVHRSFSSTVLYNSSEVDDSLLALMNIALYPINSFFFYLRRSSLEKCNHNHYYVGLR